MRIPFIIHNQQLGLNCNDRDEIVLEDFQGFLAWTYAQKTAARQTYDGILAPMTDDRGGFADQVTVRCDAFNEPLTMTVGQELAIPECKGSTVRIAYTATDHVAAIFIESEAGGVLKNASI